jgi:hypothetical protein
LEFCGEVTEVKGCGTCKKCFIHYGKNLIMAKPNQTAQTHTVHTDALGTIGMILPEGAGRDAIHIAVEPAKSGEIVYPGQHVGYNSNGLVSSNAEEKLGIVDPFLTSPVYPGQPFWLLVYPRTITSLRHVWEHPNFPPVQTERIVEKEVIKEVEVNKEVNNPLKPRTYEEATKWLENWLNVNGSVSLNNIIDAYNDEGNYVSVNDYTSIMIDGEYIHVSGSDASGYIPDEFFDNLEVILGRRIRNRPEYFSCAC